MLLLLTSIAVIIDITENIEDFISNQLSLWTIINEYYIHFIPWIVMMLAPIFVFISVIYFTSKLTDDSEIIAMLAGRVNFYRLIVPYLISSFLLTGLFLMANHYWLPNSNKKFFEFKDKYTSSSTEQYKDNVHFQFKKDTLVYAQSWNNIQKTGYKFTLEVFEGRIMKYKASADRIVWDSIQNNWKFENIIERTIYNELESKIEKHEVKNFNWGFKPADFLVQINIKESMTTPELERFIVKQKAKGAENLEFYEIEKYKRTAVPISTIILTIIAYSITTRKRRNGMGIYIVVGLALSSIYIMIQQFSSVFSTMGNLQPQWGAWIPNISFSVIALLLLWKAPK